MWKILVRSAAANLDEHRIKPNSRCILVIAALVLSLGGCSFSQRSPEATVESFLEDVSKGEMAAACERIDPAFRELLARFGGCQAALSSDYPPDRAKQLSDATVDSSLITVFGESATLEEGAVKDDGVAVKMSLNKLVKHDGKWWLTAAVGF